MNIEKRRKTGNLDTWTISSNGNQKEAWEIRLEREEKTKKWLKGCKE